MKPPAKRTRPPRPKQLRKLPVVTHVDDLVQSSAQAKRGVTPRPRVGKA